MPDLELVSKVCAFGGVLSRYAFHSASLNSRTTFAVFIPRLSDADAARPPTLFFLSGLTCTDENVCQKGGALRACARHNIALIVPDTSPRGSEVPDEDAYDFGQGAGFYLDATAAPFSTHYNMRTFVARELPDVIKANVEKIPIDLSRSSVFGHSMGGHGALCLALSSPGRFRSVSAFAPVCNPTASPWGRKAFDKYLGGADSDLAKSYDATELVRTIEHTFDAPILIDQGANDTFYQTQLFPERFVEAASTTGVTVKYRLHEGYDHSYYFISTFMDDHVEFHAKALAATE